MTPQERMSADEYLRNHAAPKRKYVRTEEEIQKATAEYLALTYPLAFHVANERGSKIERMLQKALGVKAGVADWCIPVAGGCWWIELKAPGKKQTPAQVLFQQRVEKIPGHRYAVCYSLDDFIGTIQGWTPNRQSGGRNDE